MSVDKVSGKIAGMIAKTTKVRALMGGTDSMRAAGKSYLPINPKESDDSYKARKDVSWLFNGLKQTVGDTVGYVFDVPVKLSANAPDQVVEWMDNADLQGRDLNSFSRDVFNDGMQAGISFILVDAPVRVGGETRADEINLNLRPFLSHIKLEDVVGFRTDVISGVTVLSQIRIKEMVEEPDGDFGTDEIKQIRVFDRDGGSVTVSLWRRNEKGEWYLYEPHRIIDGVDTIPIVPFYANRTGFFMGEPPLEDLADVNIAHWQSQSDQRNILHVARVPILFGSGIPEGSDITVSSSVAVIVSDPEAKLEWTELDGKSMDAGRQDLKDLEFQMETLGLQLMVTKTSSQSATGEALDAKKETSQLSMTADAMQDALDKAMILVSAFGGIDDVATVELNKEFTTLIITAHELNALLTMVNTGQITRATFLNEMKRRRVLSETVDVDDEIEETEIDTLALDMDAAPADDKDNATVVDFLDAVKESLNG